MKTLIEGYRNHPGEHCGSVAMRSLLEHYCGLELPEDVVFGLGAGAATVYMELPGNQPSAMVAGRTLSMEMDLAHSLGLDYEEKPEPDDAKAWQDVREEVLVGRPTMLSGDIFYLDYREYKVHFPGHRFVLLGFDDEREVVQIADRINVEPETCSYGALFRSRNPPEGLSTQNLWGRFGSGEMRNDLPTANRIALETCAKRMLGDGVDDSGGFGDDAGGTSSVGVAALRRFADELPNWREREDATFLASYNGSVIEKFGNGGGNFRRLYAGYLEWARELDAACVPEEVPALAVQSADGWTAIAKLLWAAGDGEDTWKQAAEQATALADLEQRLFERIAEALPAAG
jgi:hypothetical protein